MYIYLYVFTCAACNVLLFNGRKLQNEDEEEI
jgi:hypothetical protein